MVVKSFQVLIMAFRDAGYMLSFFQISSLVNIGDWQLRNDEARKADQQKLVDRLNDLEANQNRLVEILSKYTSLHIWRLRY